MILSVVLVGLLASCPIVCGTAHASSCHDDHDHRASGNAPLPTPANDDCCVCNGALASSQDAPTDALGIDLPAGPWAWALAPGLDGSLAADQDASAGASPVMIGLDRPPLHRGSATLPYLRC